MEIRGSHLGQLHAQLVARDEARQRNLELRVGKKKMRFPASASRCGAVAMAARIRPASVAARNFESLIPKASAAALNHAVVPSAPSGKGAAICVAPRSSSARAVS